MLLLARESGFITGQKLTVDGGQNMWLDSSGFSRAGPTAEVNRQPPVSADMSTPTARPAIARIPHTIMNTHQSAMIIMQPLEFVRGAAGECLADLRRLHR
jgi:hypothetical protein